MKTKKLARVPANKIDLMGKQFGRLLVIGEGKKTTKSTKAHWLCKCECGNLTTVISTDLSSGNTTSCGCYRKELFAEVRVLGTKATTKYEPMITTARKVYHDDYCDGNLSFDEFLILSKENCNYCGCQPSSFKGGDGKRNSDFYNANCSFTYQGLDRINSDLPHNKDNVCPCCKWCNYAKRDRSVEEFVAWINLLYANINKGLDRERDIVKREYLKSELAAAKCILQDAYSDENMYRDVFLSLIAQNCYYCDSEPSNKTKCRSHKDKGTYLIYNGLDRKDSSFGHTIDNCVPCCKHCNYAKRERSVDEFISWAQQVYRHINKKDEVALTQPHLK